MKNSFCLLIFCILICSQIAYGQTQENSSVSTPSSVRDIRTGYPNLKKQAEEVGEATINGNFAKLIDFTYPNIVEMAGGKEKMIASLEKEFAEMKSDGFEMISMTIDEIKQVEKIENELYAVLIITLTMKSPNGKAAGESSVIGISNDNGTNWKFVNGVNQKRFNEMFPKAAEKIQVPSEKLPKSIEN